MKTRIKHPDEVKRYKITRPPEYVTHTINKPKMTLPDSLAFLGATRFWKLVLATSLVILGYYGVIDMVLAEMLAGMLGVSIVIRTVDRAFE